MRAASRVRCGPCRRISAADLLLFKLVAGRLKDRVDIENILAIQGVPEREYLEAWADRLGVRERLTQVLREAGLL